MKLTYRDKIIAAVLIALAVLALGFFALIRPILNEKKDNEKQLATLQQTKATIEKEIAEIPGLKNDILQTHEKTKEITEIFVPVKDVENPIVVDRYMQEMAEKNKVKIQSLKVAGANVAEIGYYYYDREDRLKEARTGADINGNLQALQDASNADAINLKDRPKTKILTTDYSITAYGTKKNIWDYLEEIKKFDKALTVKRVTLGDYSFGQNAAKSAGGEIPDDSDEVQEFQVGGATISNATQAQIIVTLYSVYEMDTPNVD